MKITFFFSEYSTTLVYGSMSVTDEKLQNQETFFLEKCFREIVLWPNDLYVGVLEWGAIACILKYKSSYFIQEKCILGIVVFRIFNNM